MSTPRAAFQNRSNLWGLAPRTTSPETKRLGTATIATSLPPRSSCDYWKRRLEGIPLELSLGFSSPENRIEETAVTTLAVETPEELSNRLRALARAELTTPHTVMLAVWQAVLFRYSGQSDFVVGCGAPGGKSSVQERPHLVHATVTSRTTFRDLLRLVAMRRAEGATHGDIALPDLVKTFAGETAPHRHPVFQTAFIQRNSLTDGGSHAIATRHSDPVELACVWEDNGRTFRMRAEYPAGVIAPDIAARVPSHFINLLRAAISLPEAPIATLPMLTTAEYLDKTEG